MAVRESVSLTWEEWLASRAAKREALARYGLSATSRRTTAIGSADKRLRKAFNGQRLPTWAI